MLLLPLFPSCFHIFFPRLLPLSDSFLEKQDSVRNRNQVFCRRFRPFLKYQFGTLEPFWLHEEKTSTSYKNQFSAGQSFFLNLKLPLLPLGRPADRPTDLARSFLGLRDTKRLLSMFKGTRSVGGQMLRSPYMYVARIFGENLVANA